MWAERSGALNQTRRSTIDQGSSESERTAREKRHESTYNIHEYVNREEDVVRNATGACAREMGVQRRDGASEHARITYQKPDQCTNESDGEDGNELVEVGGRSRREG